MTVFIDVIIIKIGKLFGLNLDSGWKMETICLDKGKGIMVQMSV